MDVDLCCKLLNRIQSDRIESICMKQSILSVSLSHCYCCPVDCSSLSCSLKGHGISFLFVIGIDIGKEA